LVVAAVVLHYYLRYLRTRRRGPKEGFEDDGGEGAFVGLSGEDSGRCVVNDSDNQDYTFVSESMGYHPMSADTGAPKCQVLGEGLGLLTSSAADGTSQSPCETVADKPELDWYNPIGSDRANAGGAFAGLEEDVTNGVKRCYLKLKSGATRAELVALDQAMWKAGADIRSEAMQLKYELRQATAALEQATSRLDTEAGERDTTSGKLVKLAGDDMAAMGPAATSISKAKTMIVDELQPKIVDLQTELLPLKQQEALRRQAAAAAAAFWTPEPGATYQIQNASTDQFLHVDADYYVRTTPDGGSSFKFDVSPYTNTKEGSSSSRYLKITLVNSSMTLSHYNFVTNVDAGDAKDKLRAWEIHIVDASTNAATIRSLYDPNRILLLQTAGLNDTFKKPKTLVDVTDSSFDQALWKIVKTPATRPLAPVVGGLYRFQHATGGYLCLDADNYVRHDKNTSTADALIFKVTASTFKDDARGEKFYNLTQLGTSYQLRIFNFWTMLDIPGGTASTINSSDRAWAFSPEGADGQFTARTGYADQLYLQLGDYNGGMSRDNVRCGAMLRQPDLWVMTPLVIPPPDVALGSKYSVKNVRDGNYLVFDPDNYVRLGDASSKLVFTVGRSGFKDPGGAIAYITLTVSKNNETLYLRHYNMYTALLPGGVNDSICAWNVFPANESGDLFVVSGWQMTPPIYLQATSEVAMLNHTNAAARPKPKDGSDLWVLEKVV
jgi:hypothetical protein